MAYRCRPSSRLCKMAVAVIFAVVYVLRGTKYASLRLTSFDTELQSLKTAEAFAEYGNNNNNGTILASKECFWYSDNLYHLMCAVLTDRPIQFHALTNRVPKMHRELFRLLDAPRCSTSAKQNHPKGGAGWEDVERELPQVRRKLHHLQEACQMSQNKQLPPPHKPKNCLHLARNFNRRLQNCTEALAKCDRIVFDDTLSFCQLWNAVQEYETIVSPHGFQLVLPILAHAAAAARKGPFQQQTNPSQLQQQQRQPPTTVRIVEIRWLGYGDRSYQELTRVFGGMNHTLLYGMTPNGKLNTADNDCVKIKECRKAERQQDLFCTSETQLDLEDALHNRQSAL